MLRIALAALHLLALAIGLQAVLQRAQWLSKPLTGDVVKKVLHADSEWGVAALLWLGTGLWRYLGPMDRSVPAGTPGSRRTISKASSLIWATCS